MNDLSPMFLIFAAIVLIWLFNSIKILREYERAVIFRLGRVLPQPSGPGFIFVFSPFERMVRVSLRIDTLEVPSQDVVTRDNVSVKVNAVIYFRVVDPKAGNHSSFQFSVRHLAVGTDYTCAACSAKWTSTRCSASAKSSTCGCNPFWISIRRHGA